MAIVEALKNFSTRLVNNSQLIVKHFLGGGGIFFVLHMCEYVYDVCVTAERRSFTW